MIVIDAAPGCALPQALTVVVVEAAGIAFAMPADTVTLVTEPVPVTPLPLVPEYIEGLVGLGGAILPLIDLRRRLGLPPAWPADPEELLVMAALDGDYALRVDHVLSLATMEGDTVQVFDTDTGVNAHSDIPPGMVSGEFPWRGRTVLLLDPIRVGLRDLTGGDEAGWHGDGTRTVGLSAAAPTEPHHTYVVARAGAGLYALPVEQVAEVVPADGHMTRIPGTSPEVVGIAQLRGRPLPVLAPAVLCTVPQDELPPARDEILAAGVLLVVNTEAGRFALRVDSVLGIRHFPLSRIHAGTAVSGAVEGRAGYLVDSEDRVIGLLDADRLVKGAAAASWRALLPPAEVHAAPTVEDVALRNLLVFRVGAEWCALDASEVVHLTGYRAPAALPNSAGELEGAVEVGADVVPLVDMRKALGAPAIHDDWTAIIVVRDHGERWALVTDRIDRLVAVPEESIQSADVPPHPLVVAITRVGDRLLSVLNPAPLFRRE